MWNPNIKAINITKLVQMIFSAWFGYFEYVGYLPRGMTLIVLNKCLDLITINFNWSTQPWSTVQREISSTQTTFEMFDQSQQLLHMRHKSFFAFQLRFYLSWKIKHNMPKMLLLSSIFSIKMATQKFTNFDVYFLNTHWYDSCHDTI